MYVGDALVFSASYVSGVGDIQPSADGSGFSVATGSGTESYTWTPSGFTPDGNY